MKKEWDRPKVKEKKDLSSGQFWLLVIRFDRNSKERRERETERQRPKNYKIKKKGYYRTGQSLCVHWFICSIYVVRASVCVHVCEESSHRSFQLMPAYLDLCPISICRSSFMSVCVCLCVPFPFHSFLRQILIRFPRFWSSSHTKTHTRTTTTNKI